MSRTDKDRSLLALVYEVSPRQSAPARTRALTNVMLEATCAILSNPAKCPSSTPAVPPPMAGMDAFLQKSRPDPLHEREELFDK